MLKILYYQKILEIFYSIRNNKSISYLLEDVFRLCSVYCNIFLKSGLFLYIAYIIAQEKKEDAREEVDINLIKYIIEEKKRKEKEEKEVQQQRKQLENMSITEEDM